MRPLQREGKGKGKEEGEEEEEEKENERNASFGKIYQINFGAKEYNSVVLP